MKLITERLSALESFCKSLDIALIGCNDTKGGIYSLSIMTEIRIQGNFSSIIVNRIKNVYPDVISEISQNGYVEFEINAFDDKFHVVLT